MAHIGIRSQHIPHLDQMHFLSFHAKVYGAFAACQAAAHDGYGVTDLILFFVVVVDDHDIIAVESRDRRYQRSRADCNDQGIRLLLLDVFFRHLCVQADLHAGVTGKFLICSRQLIHLIFERQCLLAL